MPTPSLPTRRREIVIDSFGKADVLGVREGEMPTPGPGEVLVAVDYSGVNFADIMMRLGFYPDAPKKPFVPGYEVSGRIAALGAGVDRFALGEEVIAGCLFGGYASHVVLPATQVVAMPKGLDLKTGAALPVAFSTAHLALNEMARMRAGDRILIESAAGGVGTIAVQMAVRAGAEVIGLTSSESKLDYISDLGARPMLAADFQSKDSERGFDIILNSSGGRSVGWQRKRLAMTGRIVCFGMSSGIENGRRNYFKMAKAALTTPRVPILRLFNDSNGVYALNALHVLGDESWAERIAAALAEVNGSSILPYVDAVVAADQVPEAHRRLETRQARGKLLLGWN